MKKPPCDHQFMFCKVEFPGMGLHSKIMICLKCGETEKEVLLKAENARLKRKYRDVKHELQMERTEPYL